MEIYSNFEYLDESKLTFYLVKQIDDLRLDYFDYTADDVDYPKLYSCLYLQTQDNRRAVIKHAKSKIKQSDYNHIKNMSIQINKKSDSEVSEYYVFNNDGDLKFKYGVQPRDFTTPPNTSLLPDEGLNLPYKNLISANQPVDVSVLKYLIATIQQASILNPVKDMGPVDRY